MSLSIGEKIKAAAEEARLVEIRAGLRKAGCRWFPHPDGEILVQHDIPAPYSHLTLDGAPLTIKQISMSFDIAEPEQVRELAKAAAFTPNSWGREAAEWCVRNAPESRFARYYTEWRWRYGNG